MDTCPVCGVHVEDLIVTGGSPKYYDVKCTGCGKFQLETAAAGILRERAQGREFIMAALLFEHRDRSGTPLRIELGDLDYYLSEDRIPSVSERIDRLLKLVYRSMERIGHVPAIPFRIAVPTLFCRSSDEFIAFANLLAMEMGFVLNKGGRAPESLDIALTPKGFLRLDEIRSPRAGEGRRCFVATWFDDRMDRVYKEGVRPAVLEAGFEPRWIKEVHENGKICDRIIAELRSSLFAIADVTGLRHNVFFEAGFAKGQGLEVIWTCRKNSFAGVRKLFDTRQYGHIVWKDPADLKQQLLDKIRATIPGAKGP